MLEVGEAAAVRVRVEQLNAEQDLSVVDLLERAVELEPGLDCAVVDSYILL